MQLRAIAIGKWVLPVPVPPINTALRCWARNPPSASSRTRASLIGVPSNWKSSRSLASGSLAMVSWYLIERACFSFISAVRRSPMIAGKLAPNTLHRGRQHPVLEGRAVPQGAGLASQHGHVMPGVVDRLATPERAGMLADDSAILADHDLIRVGMDLNRAPD